MEKEKVAAKEAAPKKQPVQTATEIAAGIKTEKWKPRSRVYKLDGRARRTPNTVIQSQDRPGNSRLLHFDEEKQTQRAIRYVINFDSPFIDEQDASGWDLVQEHIVFQHGQLAVDAHNVSLQKFLDVHPWNTKNGGNGPVKFYEYDPEAEAKEEVDSLMIEVDAISAARDADLATTEAVLRPRLGHRIHEMKTDRLTREILLYAKKQPKEFLEAINNEDLLLENVVYTAVDFRILQFKDSGLTLTWAKNGEKLLAIPFGNDPYKFVAEWFKTSEGLEILNKVTQVLKKQ